MSKQVNINHTDTPIAGVTTLPLNRGLVNFGKDYRIVKNDVSEIIMTNMTAPIDAPEKFRVSASDVTDVYKNTGIDPSLFAPTKRGRTVLVQLTENVTVVDTVDPTYRVVLPLESHIVVKVPNNENLTVSMIETFVARMLSGLYESGTTTSVRIAALLKGALSPADM